MENNTENMENLPSPAPQSESESKSKQRLGGFRTRFITAAVILVVYVAVLALTIAPGALGWRFVYDGFVILVTVFATLECARAFSNKYSPPMRVFLIVFIVLGYGAFYFVHFWLSPYKTGGITAYFSVLVLMLLSCIIFNMFSNRSSMNNVLTTMLVLVYPAAICVYMLALNYLPGGIEMSNSAILLMFLLPAASDTGAFTFGSLLKGPKLAPHISPKKTISGAVGGGIGGMLAGAIVLGLSIVDGSRIARLSGNIGWNIAHYLIIGAVGSLFVLVGDLIASYVKRQCGVKDFGKLLPGHGGILDRMDSNILTSVFLYVYFLIINII